MAGRGGLLGFGILKFGESHVDQYLVPHVNKIMYYSKEQLLKAYRYGGGVVELTNVSSFTIKQMLGVDVIYVSTFADVTTVEFKAPVTITEIKTLIGGSHVVEIIGR